MKPIYSLILGIATIAFVACSRPSAGFVPDSNETLSNKILINKGYNIVFLQNILGDDVRADSVISDTEHIEVGLTDNGKALMLRARPKTPHTSIVSCWIDGQRYDLITRFLLDFDLTYTYRGALIDSTSPLTFISQAFNWNPYSLPELTLNENNEYAVRMMVSSGAYPFYLLQNGHKLLDPAAERYVNHQGDTLSVFDLHSQIGQGPILRSDRQKNHQIELQPITEALQIYALWGNKRLPDKFTHIRRNNIKINIPTEADSLPLSWLRLVGINGVSSSNEVIVPLNYGQVSNEVYPLPLVAADSQRTDAYLPALNNNDFTIAHTLLLHNMHRYGDHQLLVPTNPHSSTEALYYATAPSFSAGQSKADNPLIPTEWDEFFDHNAALAYGDFFEWQVLPRIWVYERHYFGQSVIVILNNELEDCTVEVPVPKYHKESKFESLDEIPFTIEDQRLKLELKAGQSRVLVKINEEP
ncbi:MAG: hypothetical protein J5808_00070 [Paludibacteraceae bacterium]|nr:hypothetical protein [Paludibacteraceae bacterium]